MRNILPFIASLLLMSLTPQETARIGEKIWKNECGGTLEGLTHWNQGEDFASLGIGHFIWYSAGRHERFEETFPSLLTFLQQKKATFPDWLKETSCCPWNSREEFYHEIKSPKMKSLRQFLFDTKHLQALFMANRLEETWPQILKLLPVEKREPISQIFRRLSHDPQGLFALIDYVNFKGSGLSSHETYQGQGWGLLHVLERMPAPSSDPLIDFVKAARAVLTQRVHNSPPERNEQKWLQGWMNRLDGYLLTR
jgi:hypothetical protein